MATRVSCSEECCHNFINQDLTFLQPSMVYKMTVSDDSLSTASDSTDASVIATQNHNGARYSPNKCSRIWSRHWWTAPSQNMYQHSGSVSPGTFNSLWIRSFRCHRIPSRRWYSRRVIWLYICHAHTSLRVTQSETEHSTASSEEARWLI